MNHATNVYMATIKAMVARGVPYEDAYADVWKRAAKKEGNAPGEFHNSQQKPQFHERDEAIAKAIEAEPGITIAKLSLLKELSEFQVYDALQRLAQAGKVHSKRRHVGNQSGYFPGPRTRGPK